MAAEHELWIADLFGDLTPRSARTSCAFSRKTKNSARRAMGECRVTHYANPVTLPLAEYRPRHFQLAVEGPVATVTLNRPEKKNPLTFESYRELTDFFHACAKDEQVKAIVVTGAGGNFSSGGDVFEIIGPLVEMDTKGLTAFTRMTGELVKAMPPRRSRSSRPWKGFARAPAPSSPWRRSALGWRRARRSLSCSTRWALPAATWAPAPSCPGSSARGALPSYSIRAVS